MSDQRNALVFLSPKLPYPPTTGEKITTFNLLRHLVRHYRVFVGTFAEPSTTPAEVERLRALVADVHAEPWSRFSALAAAVPRWLAGDPLSFAIYRSTGLERWLREIERIHRPVAIVTHSSNISDLAVGPFQRQVGPQPVRILHFADVDSEKFAAYAARAGVLTRWFYRMEAARVRRAEERLTALADSVAFVSDEEAALFRSMLASHRDRVVTLPNGVDTSIFSKTLYPAQPREIVRPSIVFSGAMDYPPNVEAATWFAREVLPSVETRIPGIQFLIVGARPASAVRALARDNSVVVTGAVESVAAYLAHADVAVAPLRIARGVQNKVLEAMAMELPTVVSPGAFTGIAAEAGAELIVADQPEEWVKACVQLIEDPSGARTIGTRARARVVKDYSWEAQFDKLDELLASGTTVR